MRTTKVKGVKEFRPKTQGMLKVYRLVGNVKGVKGFPQLWAYTANSGGKPLAPSTPLTRPSFRALFWKPTSKPLIFPAFWYRIEKIIFNVSGKGRRREEERERDRERERERESESEENTQTRKEHALSISPFALPPFFLLWVVHFMAVPSRNGSFQDKIFWSCWKSGFLDH